LTAVALAGLSSCRLRVWVNPYTGIIDCRRASSKRRRVYQRSVASYDPTFLFTSARC
jgi:hypothetical protein